MEPSEVDDFNQRPAPGGALGSPRASRSGAAAGFMPPGQGSGQGSGKGSGRGGVREGGAAQGEVTRRGTMLRASDQYSSDTLFQLVPQYPREGAIGLQMHLRVRHVVSGMWLHVDMQPTDELTPAQTARAEEERALKTDLLRTPTLTRSPTLGLTLTLTRSAL